MNGPLELSDAGELIERLGGSKKVAEDLNRPIGTVAAWRHRKSIPVDEWPAIIRLAVERKLHGVNADRLLVLHAGGDANAAA